MALAGALVHGGHDERVGLRPGNQGQADTCREDVKNLVEA
jgi:hypothetical protein